MTQPPITSLTNPRVKAAVRLRDRRERELTGLTIVDGAREILRALDAGVRVETAFLAEDLLRTPDAHAVADRLRHRPATIAVSPAVLAKVAFGERSDGIVAIVETPQLALADLVARRRAAGRRRRRASRSRATSAPSCARPTAPARTP